MRTNTQLKINPVDDLHTEWMPEIISIENESDAKTQTSGEISPSSLRIYFAFGVLAFLQLLDAFFTFAGVRLYGVEMEANPLIRVLIENIGPFWGIFSIKAFALLAVLHLWFLKDMVGWINKAVYGLSAYYIIFAIIPWTYILATV